MPPKFDYWVASFLALRCEVCQQISPAPLCPACAENLPAFHQRCQTCSSPLVPVCPRCEAAPPALARLLVRWRYRDAVRNFVWRAKFSADRVALQILSDEAAFLARTISSGTFDAVIPLPIAPVRLWQRGFNQSLFLARAVAKTLSLPVLNGVLRRQQRPQQAHMSNDDARRENIRGAFFVRGAVPSRVIVVDDVFTTGATMNEAARTLRAAGAKQIVAVAVAGR